jgi:hypothetical protein
MRAFCAAVMLFTALLVSACTSPLSAPKASISGGAWVVKKNGGSELLRGLDVFLCSDKSKSAIDNQGWHIWELNIKAGEDLRSLKLRPNAEIPELQREIKLLSLSQQRHFVGVADGMMGIRRVVEQIALRTIKTEVDAKYQFAEVPAGSYVLFAAFRFDFVAGCWEIPIEVQDSKPIQLDLENSNMALSTESGLGPWALQKPLIGVLPSEWGPRDNPQRK